MNRERPLNIKIDPISNPEPRMPHIGGTGFKDIADPALRGDLRTGDLLIESAFVTESVQNAILYSGVTPEQISGSNDLIDLSPSRVIQRVQEAVGIRGAINVVERAIEVVTSSEGSQESIRSLNGDSEYVEANLFRIREQLVSERILESAYSQSQRFLGDMTTRKASRNLGGSTVVEIDSQKS